MTTLGEVIAVVDLVTVLVTRAVTLVETAELLWSESADHLAGALAGSQMAEADELARLDDVVLQRFADLRADLSDLGERIETYRASLVGHGSTSAAGTRQSGSSRGCLASSHPGMTRGPTGSGRG